MLFRSRNVCLAPVKPGYGLEGERKHFAGVLGGAGIRCKITTLLGVLLHALVIRCPEALVVRLVDILELCAHGSVVVVTNGR